MTKLAIAVFLFLVLCPLSALAWNGKEDNKTAAELELMKGQDLTYEALGPCLYLAFWNGHDKEHYVLPVLYKAKILRRKREAKEYLKAVQRVAQKKNRGKAPPWIEAVLEAASGKDARKCAAAWKAPLQPRMGTSGERRQETPAEGEKTKRSMEK